MNFLAPVEKEPVFSAGDKKMGASLDISANCSPNTATLRERISLIFRKLASDFSLAHAPGYVLEWLRCLSSIAAK